jgi:aminoglycoside phosphotransferase (APT) family kinase protein
MTWSRDRRNAQEGTSVVAATRPPPAAGRPRAAGGRNTRRGLSIRVVRLSVAGRRGRDRAARHRSEPAGDRSRQFVAALQQIDPTGGPPPGEHNFSRGEPLAARDAPTRAAIISLRGAIDVGTVTAAWESALRSPEWEHPPVWIHGDLDSRNLLVEEGRVSAVIDWGGLGVGDPACDVMVAWKVLSADSRDIFRTALSVDESTWARARGWALSQALGALSYYTPETNPVLFLEGQRWMAEVLAEISATQDI